VPDWVVQVITIVTLTGGAFYVVARIEATTYHMTRVVDRLTTTIDRLQEQQKNQGNRLTVLETILAIIAPEHFKRKE